MSSSNAGRRALAAEDSDPLNAFMLSRIHTAPPERQRCLHQAETKRIFRFRLKRLQILHKRMALVWREPASDNATAFRRIIEFMADIAVAGDRRIEFKSTGEFLILIAEIHRVVVAPAEIEFGRALLGRREQ